MKTFGAMLNVDSLSSNRHVLRVRCQLPADPSSPAIVSVTHSHKKNQKMTSTSNLHPKNLFALTTSKFLNTRSSCQICNRFVYSFEEVFYCRLCQSVSHWRCLKREASSFYDDQTHFICEKCSDMMTITTTSTSSTSRMTNSGLRIKSSNSSEDLDIVPHNKSNQENNVVQAIRYFEEKQQRSSQSSNILYARRIRINDYPSSSSETGSYSNDLRKIHEIPPVQQSLKTQVTPSKYSSKNMFQANYHYTPLKEGAALKTVGLINETNSNNLYQNPSNKDNEKVLSTARYGTTATGLKYTEYNQDGARIRVIDPLPNSSVQLNNQTVDRFSTPAPQSQHYVSTTNLNINENSSYRQSLQRNNGVNHSTPHLSRLGQDEPPKSRPSTQTSSSVDESGIGSSNVAQQSALSTEHYQLIESKLNELVQKFGRQMDFETKKINEKLETRLTQLETMINQQTFIIQRQDQIIEQLKSKVQNLEVEREQIQAQLIQYGKEEKLPAVKNTETSSAPTPKDGKPSTSTGASSIRKLSTHSSDSNETSRTSTKKTAAPRVDQTASGSSMSQLLNNNPLVSRELATNSLTTKQLVTSVPIHEQPAAATRLDTIIHLPSNEHVTDQPTQIYYNIDSTHDYKGSQGKHVQSSATDRIESNDYQQATNSLDDGKLNRSGSASTQSVASSSVIDRGENDEIRMRSNNSSIRKSPQTYRSLDVLPNSTTQTDNQDKQITKAVSLDLIESTNATGGSGSVYGTPIIGKRPASQTDSTMQGWMRKLNPDSFFKRLERYYCVLKNDQLLMYRNQTDRAAHKVINLKDAKIRAPQDSKYQTSIALIWPYKQRENKRYLLSPENAADEPRWRTAIENAIAESGTQAKETT